MISQEERHLFAPQTSHRDLSHRSLVTLQTNFLVQILNARMATFGDVDGGVLCHSLLATCSSRFNKGGGRDDGRESRHEGHVARD